MNVKQIIIALIDRLAAYAAREAESESPVDVRRQEEEAARLAAEEKKRRITDQLQGNEGEDGRETIVTEEAADEEPREPKEEGAEGDKKELDEEKKAAEEEAQASVVESEAVKRVRGIPEDVQLFVVFWGQIVELVKVR